MTLASEIAGIARKTAYAARKLTLEDGRARVGNDLAKAQEFASAWDDSIDASIDMLEAEARRRAYDGLLRKKFNRQGDPIIDPETGSQYIEREYSDTLMLTLLRAHRPDKFGDRSRTENFNLDLSTLNEKQLELVRDGASLPTILAAASAGGDGTPSASAE